MSTPSKDFERKVEEGIGQAKSVQEKAKNYIGLGHQILQKAEEVERFFDWTKQHSEGLELLLSEPGSSLCEAVSRCDNTMGTIILSLKKVDGSLEKGSQYLEPALSGSLVCATSSSEVVTAIRAECSALGDEFFNYEDSVTRIYTQDSPFDHKTVQADLDAFLETLTAELVEKRKSAWITLHSLVDNRVSLACYAMRDIVTAILDEHCPVDSVKNARWWKSAPDTKEGVSKLQKIKYFVCGLDEVDTSGPLMELIVDGVEECKRLHNKLVNLAHGSSDGAVEKHLEAMENALRNIFQLREAVRKARFNADEPG